MNEKYNLTFPQQNIWLEDRLYGNSKVNLITGIININKGLNIEYCKKAINNIIKSNDAMRIHLYINDNKPYQKVEEYLCSNIEVIKIENEENKNEYINKFKSEDIDIQNDKLYSFKILDYGNEKGSILLKMHHIISDAWSYSKIIEQFVKNYESLEKTGNVIEDEVPSYISYINSTEEYKNSEKYRKDEEFWKEYLDGISSKISIKDNTKKIENSSSRYNVKLNKELNDKIISYCKNNKISPYVMFLTALSTYMYRITEKNDIVIGTPSLNRSNFKEKQMIGMFVSTLPLRVKIEENIKFLDLAHEIAKNTMSMFRHQKFPYIKTLKGIRERSNFSDNLYGMMLSYQNARVEFEDKEKYDTKWYGNNYQNEDLQIHILDMDSTGILEINYDYLNELFSIKEIEYLHTRIIAIIENAILDENIDVENIEIMSKEEKNKILYEFNDTKTYYPKDKSVIELFEEQVKKHPNDIALVFENEKLTYEELNNRANTVANFLIEKKEIVAGDIIGIKFNRGIEMIVSILAVSKCNAAYLPIDPNYPHKRIEYMVNNSGAKFVLENISNLDYSKEKVIKYKTNLNSPAYILYTSGSTGKPKAVITQNYNLLNFVFSINKILKINNRDNILSITTVSFDIFEMELWLPLVNGATIVLASEKEKYNPYLLNEMCLKNMVSLIQTTPSIYKTLLLNKDNTEFLKKVKKIVLGGEKVSNSLINSLNDISCACKYDGYGPTETTIYSSMKLLDKEISVGKPIGNTHILVKDRKSRILPLGIPGEVCISGDGVSKGYLNNLKLTNEKFKKEKGKIWYQTGDLGVINFELNLNILDRIDFQIKINGQRVEVEEIENIIYCNKKIKECVVVLINDVLTCVYNGDVTKNEIKTLAEKRLPNYMIPKKYIYLQDFPKTLNGKIDRKRIKNMNFEDDLVLRDIKYAETKIQREIEKIINDVRGKSEKIDINTSFFELGLDSLDIIKLIVFINEKYEIDIKYQDVLYFNTVAKIETFIINCKPKKYIEDLSKVYDKKVYQINNTQKSIYYNYLKNSESITYNVPFEISVNKNIDKEKLRVSILNSLYNHEILFSKFIERDGRIYGKIDDKIECNFDFKNVSKDKYESIKRNFVKPFDLKNSKLFRIEAYEVEEKVYILFDFSHIIVDGYSICILLNEIENLYNNKHIKVEKNSFIESIYNQNIDNSSKDFFINMFKDDFVPTKIEGDNINVINNDFGKKLVKKINNLKNIEEYCRKNDITLNIFILSIYLLVIKELNKRCTDYIVIGITSLGRELSKFNNSVGMFVNTIPYKINVDKNNSLSEFYNCIKINLSEIYKNNKYSYQDLINDLNISPFLNILYTYQDKGLPKIQFAGYKVNIEEIKTYTSKFEINLEVSKNDEDNILNLCLEYKNIYSDKKAESMINLILELIKLIIKEKSYVSIKEIQGYIKKHITNDEFLTKNVELKNKKYKAISNNLTINDEKDKLLNIYKKVLDNKEFTIYDNFFEIGGDSLSLMRIYSELTKLGYNISYFQLFEYKTVNELYEFFNNKKEQYLPEISGEKELYEIDELLKSIRFEKNYVEFKKIKNVMITGVTGFLGIYLLRKFCMDNEIEHVYCLVRSKDRICAKKRLNNLLNFYFNSNEVEIIKNKMIIIEVDITKYDNLENFISLSQIKKIDVIINAAARVKHFGLRKPFYEINVKAVNNLINFCLKYNKKLIHISTISVSGNYIEESQERQDQIKENTYFDEFNFYVGQNINNIYVSTKFEAEKNIFEAIIHKGLNAKIVRVGNLTSSYENGKFQKNFNENAFIQRLKTFIQLKYYPCNLEKLYFEFTPVDYAADAIERISKIETKNIVFHLYNLNHLSMHELIQYLYQYGFNIKSISEDEFKKMVRFYVENDYEKIEGILPDMNDELEIKYVDNIKIKCDETIKILKKIGFEWPVINFEYIKKLLDYLKKIKFIENGRDNG